MHTQRRGFGGVVNFLSLLSAYWVLSAYFLAVFEISAYAYLPVYTVLGGERRLPPPTRTWRGYLRSRPLRRRKTSFSTHEATLHYDHIVLWEDFINFTLSIVTSAQYK